MISSLTSLSQLHLSAGNQAGWRYDWQINHDTLRASLCRLPLLTKIAFSRDSYVNPFVHGFVESYYSDKICSRPGQVLDQEQKSASWEDMHRKRMLREGEKWIMAMEGLEWLYFGQLPMKVRRKGGDRRVVLEGDGERDDLYTFLGEMFGFKDM